MSETTGAVRGALKSGTAEAHTRLDEIVALGHADLDEAAYAAHLAAMFGYLEPLEARLAAMPGLAARIPDFDARWRTPWLLADLRALGAPVGALPRARALPQIVDLDAALGCLYVLEGSTLGGRVLAKRVAQAVPGVHPRATRWLRAHGDQTGARWRMFLGALETADATRALPAAQQTFSTLESWLREQGVARVVRSGGG